MSPDGWDGPPRVLSVSAEYIVVHQNLLNAPQR